MAAPDCPQDTTQVPDIRSQFDTVQSPSGQETTQAAEPEQSTLQASLELHSTLQDGASVQSGAAILWVRAT